jgi:hypothetical protein
MAIQEANASLEAIATFTGFITPRSTLTLDTFAAGVPWVQGETYRIEIEEGVVTETGNNRSPNPALPNYQTFTTNTTAGVSLSSQSNKRLFESFGGEVTFNRGVRKGSGSISLYDASNDQLICIFDVQTTDISFDGRKLIFADDRRFEFKKSYYLIIESGALVDADGFTLDGNIFVTEFSFTLAPSRTPVTGGDTKFNTSGQYIQRSADGRKINVYDYSDASLTEPVLLYSNVYNNTLVYVGLDSQYFYYSTKATTNGLTTRIYRLSTGAFIRSIFRASNISMEPAIGGGKLLLPSYNAGSNFIPAINVETGLTDYTLIDQYSAQPSLSTLAIVGNELYQADSNISEATSKIICRNLNDGTVRGNIANTFTNTLNFGKLGISTNNRDIIVKFQSTNTGNPARVAAYSRSTLAPRWNIDFTSLSAQGRVSQVSDNFVLTTQNPGNSVYVHSALNGSLYGLLSNYGAVTAIRGGSRDAVILDGASPVITDIAREIRWHSLGLSATGTGIDVTARPYAVTTQGTPNVFPLGEKVGTQSMVFAAGDKLDVDFAPQFGTNKDFTIEFWFQVDSLTSENVLFGGPPQTNSIGVVVNTAGNLLVKRINTDDLLVSPAGSINANRWYHVIVRRSGATAALYINGISVASSTTLIDWQITTGLSIGGLYGETGAFSGYIDEFRISNIARNILCPSNDYRDDNNTLLLIHGGGVFGSPVFRDDYITRNSATFSGLSTLPTIFSEVCNADAFLDPEFERLQTTEFLAGGNGLVDNTVIIPSPTPTTVTILLLFKPEVVGDTGGTTLSSFFTANDLNRVTVRLAQQPAGAVDFFGGASGVVTSPVAVVAGEWNMLAISAGTGNQTSMFINGTTYTLPINVLNFNPGAGPNQFGFAARGVTNNSSNSNPSSFTLAYGGVWNGFIDWSDLENQSIIWDTANNRARYETNNLDWFGIGNPFLFFSGNYDGGAGTIVNDQGTTGAFLQPTVFASDDPIDGPAVLVSSTIIILDGTTLTSTSTIGCVANFTYASVTSAMLATASINGNVGKLLTTSSNISTTSTLASVIGVIVNDPIISITATSNVSCDFDAIIGPKANMVAITAINADVSNILSSASASVVTTADVTCDFDVIEAVVVNMIVTADIICSFDRVEEPGATLIFAIGDISCNAGAIFDTSASFATVSTLASVITVIESNPQRTPVPITARGDAQLDTQYVQFGTASALFDGTDDVWRCDTGNILFDTGGPEKSNYTIECWTRFKSAGGGIGPVELIFAPIFASGGPQVYVNANGTINGRDGSPTNTPKLQSAAGVVGVNTWQHIALVREGTLTSLYVDGVQVASTNVAFGAQIITAMGVGGYPDRPIGDTLQSNTVRGNIDEFRISDIARYSGASFTVPSARFVDDLSTFLLLHFDGLDGVTTTEDDVTAA